MSGPRRSSVRQRAVLACAVVSALSAGSVSTPGAAQTSTSRSTASSTARSTTTIETIPGIPQGRGREAPVNADGGLPTTGTTLPSGPVRVRLTAVAVANQPVGVVTRSGDAALYVIEKAGKIRVIRDGVLAPDPVIDLSTRVSSVNENGMLGLAFPAGPDAGSLAVLYLLYVDTNRNLTVSEFPFDGTQADATRERVLLRLTKRTDEHNAGTLLTTPDGLLWIAVGDGGPAGDPQNNAQRLDRLFGKVLRIDPRTPSDGLPYSIPPSNPYARVATGLSARTPRNAKREIWAYGLRNPWGISVDGVTGDVWIPDVGESSVEEINRVAPAQVPANLGWKMREGRSSFSGGKPIGALDPVYDYPHRDGRCAVIGGSVYRGAAMPALVGAYVFADVCSGRINALVPDGSRWRAVSLGPRLSYVTGFGVDGSGEMYATALEGGVVRLSPA
jgi:glucose/arabinose dehydrogenase